MATSVEMDCVYCGRTYPWPNRRYWPSMTYAECWWCSWKMYGWGDPIARRPFWLWRLLARRVCVRWGEPLTLASRDQVPVAGHRSLNLLVNERRPS